MSVRILAACIILVAAAGLAKASPSQSHGSFVVAAEEGHAAPKDKDAEEETLNLPPASAPAELSPAEQYCSNVVDAAAGAQLAQQKNNLEKAQKQLDERVALLAARTDELKGWIKKREDFTARATDSLVQIYGKMKAESAAAQLVVMDEFVAAAIMSKLSPKAASLILSEMEAPKAARLSAVIAGAGEIGAKPEPKAYVQQ